MMRTLLVRGLLAGLVAGVFAFVFARLFGEGPIEAAIAVEEAGGHSHGAPSADGPPAVEIVDRATQMSTGLAVGVLVYAVAFGGLFALAFAVAHGRLGTLSARAGALTLALIGYVVAFLIPFLTYPANPPAVGDGDTIAVRTAAFLAMVLISITAAVVAAVAARGLAPRLGGWAAGGLAIGGYLVLVAVAAWILPARAAVPDGFPATVLWDFRLASLGVQLILWLTLGGVFGALVHRRPTGNPSPVVA